MCGIGGIYKIGKRPIRKWQLKHMATELQMRGTDATGFALMDEDGSIHIWKAPDPAWKAVASEGFNRWCDKALTDKTQILLVHTRAYTKGSPHHNENNHPLYSTPVKGVIVHNGTVRNDDGLFEVNKKLPAFTRSCATDSDVFRAILDNHGKVDRKLIKHMQIVDGTAAVAGFHRASPGKLFLLRDCNPLVLGATSDTLAFASNKEALHKVLKPWIEVHNFAMQVHAPDLSFIPMRNETGYIIGPKGMEEHEEFKCNGRGVGGYVKYTKNTEYYNRQAKAEAAAAVERPISGSSYTPPLGTVVNPTSRGVKTLINLVPENKTATGYKASIDDPRLFEFTVCPNEKCNSHVELSQQDRMLASIALLACKSCGRSLAGGQDAGFVN